ncbi:MAG: uroporphyrinogen-III C-methyltransferase [Bacillota bacterium]
MKEAKVYLTGAGPGDPELISLKAKRALKEADVVLYDRLSNDALLEYSSDNAELYYVGKKAANHYYTQDEINDLLIKKAKENKVVCRLKGGDPFIFGRGGEEASVLKKEGIDFEIIPGISSFYAVPAYGGIPLTKRNLSSSFAVITGHEAANKKENSVDIKKVASSVDTLIILMGVSKLSEIRKKLLASNFENKTKIALIRWGTRSKQQTIQGNLENIEEKVKKANFQAPAVIIVGEVVKERQNLKWFENKTLFSKTVLVTRPEKQSSSFAKLLYREGANVLKAPMIKINPPTSFYDLDKAIENLKRYNFIIFTSVNGVKYFMKRLLAKDKDIRELKGIKIVVIGAKTAERLRYYGVNADFLPEKYSTEGILEGLKDYVQKNNFAIENKSFLLPRANIAPPKLELALKEMGADVNNVVAYENCRTKIDKKIYKKFFNNEIDLLTFTSSSTVKNFKKGLDDYLNLLEEKNNILDLEKNQRKSDVACIGPVTAETARKNGFEVDIIATEYTIDGLYEAIINYYKRGV